MDGGGVGVPGETIVFGIFSTREGTGLSVLRRELCFLRGDVRFFVGDEFFELVFLPVRGLLPGPVRDISGNGLPLPPLPGLNLRIIAVVI